MNEERWEDEGGSIEDDLDDFIPDDFEDSDENWDDDWDDLDEIDDFAYYDIGRDEED